MTIDGEDINIQNLCMFVQGSRFKKNESEYLTLTIIFSGEGTANYYDPKKGKMLTENINFYQRDFFALYGENEILGWFLNES